MKTFRAAPRGEYWTNGTEPTDTLYCAETDDQTVEVAEINKDPDGEWYATVHGDWVADDSRAIAAELDARNNRGRWEVWDEDFPKMPPEIRERVPASVIFWRFVIIRHADTGKVTWMPRHAWDALREILGLVEVSERD